MSTGKIAFVQSRDSVAFNLDGALKVISKTHMNFNRILDALASGILDSVRPLLVEIKQSIADSSDGSIVYRDGNLYFEGEPLHGSMVPRIISLIRDGLPVQPLTNFLRNSLDNPSPRAREEQFGFLEFNQLPVTPDGHFIAYKMVRADFTDIFTGTMDNSPGQTVRMKRSDVDPDKHQTCSKGLHFASLEYVLKGGYGSRSSGHRLVAVKINPRDVVAIPTDYNNSKGRASQYLVLRELDWDTRLPIHNAGFKLFDGDDVADDAPVAAPVASTADPVASPLGAVASPLGAVAQTRVGERVWSDAAVRNAKRLLADDIGLSEVSRQTGMSRRLLGRIRNGEVYTDILI